VLTSKSNRNIVGAVGLDGRSVGSSGGKTLTLGFTIGIQTRTVRGKVTDGP
jgi:hypothetical protein